MADATVGSVLDNDNDLTEEELFGHGKRRRYGRPDINEDPSTSNPYIPHPDPLTKEMVVTFPTEPCNSSACEQYIEAMGGCEQLCGNIYGEDHFSGTQKFGVRRRSFKSFFSKWNWTRKLICTKGVPNKFMNCGCDCKYFDDMTPKRTFLAQYECWTCFGKGGKMLKPAEIATFKQYNFDTLVDLNKKRGVRIHFLGPKHYDLRSPGITTPGGS
mmetsp:Transcript_3995/g.3467  ORF Transcript_3995/g.3467 Transcript_3995/m.3467 type:complete len:214 (+) Transcript_3995:53-694(+)